MKEWALVLCFAVAVCGEVLPPVSVNFNHSGTLYAPEKEQIVLGCEINRNQAYASQNKISIIRKSVIEGKEHLVSESSENLNMDTNYAVTLGLVQGNGIVINIRFQVTDLDEGTFICRVHDNDSHTTEDTVDIQITKPLRHFELVFNGENAVSQTIPEPIEVSPGDYTVACVASGSNPAPSVDLYYNERQIENSDSQTVTLETELRQYKTTVNGTILIRFLTSFQEIVCHASTQLEDTRNISIYIKTPIKDPEINCSETEAYEGEKHPVLICTIEFEGFNITNYTYADGNHTVEFIDVRTEKLSETEFKVYLKMAEAKDWHFKDFYLYLTHSDGHVTREAIRLQKTTGAPNSSTKENYLLMTVFIPFAFWLILYG